MIIVNTNDGYVGPWFSDEAPPINLIEVPPELLAKYKAGKIKNGIELARAALLAKADNKAEAKPLIRAPLEVVSQVVNDNPFTGKI